MLTASPITGSTVPPEGTTLWIAFPVLMLRVQNVPFGPTKTS